MGAPTLICMAVVVLAVTATAICGLRSDSSSERFFDRDESNTLRGFWCLVIMLVHVPLEYQNAIQDAIGSFAYIGVTFFFMTSAYGLEISAGSHPEKLRTFWRHRVPKLLVPCLIVNLFCIAMKLAAGGDYAPLALLRINNWVIWLLLCYLVWWAVMKISLLQGERRVAVTSLGIGSLSTLSYAFSDFSPISSWPTEMWGFIWGLLLAHAHGNLHALVCRRKAQIVGTTVLASLALGLLYLRLKSIPFSGDYLLKIGLGIALTMLMLEVDALFSLENPLGLFLGGISYEVYLIHPAVFTFLSTVAGGVSPQGRSSSSAWRQASCSAGGRTRLAGSFSVRSTVS